jgi:adenylosuccinate lyase
MGLMVICPIDSERYGSKEIRSIFDEEERLKQMLAIEAAVAWAQAQLNILPKSAAEEINRKASLKYVRLERTKEIDAEIGHDIMAVVKALTEVCEGEGKRWIHFGLTSNDIMDTATAIQIKQAAIIIRKKVIKLCKVLATKAHQYRSLPMAGRTHGQQIGVITLGFKFAVWLSEMIRHLDRFDACMKRAAVGKILGAVGTGAAVGSHALEIQALALKRLNLKPAEVVTQIIQRDIHAELISVLAHIGNSLDKFGTEIRNLQRTEIAELMEPFGADKQVGSTAMPAKRNPVRCEKTCSLAKLLRGMVITAFENVPLWHERDLSNSANERFTIPFSFILIDEMIRVMTQVLSDLVIFPENIARNLHITGGLILSERIAGALVKKGMGRQEAHELVRRSSMTVYAKNISFKEALSKNQQITVKLSPQELEELLQPETYLGSTEMIIESAITDSKKKLNERFDW